MNRAHQFLGRTIWACFGWLALVFLRRSHRVYAILECNGEVLFVKNWIGDGKWRLPGGGRHKSESSQQTVTSELLEELAVDVSQLHGISVYNGKSSYGIPIEIYRYELSSTQFTRKKSEITHAQWFAKQDLPSDIEPEILALI